MTARRRAFRSLRGRPLRAVTLEFPQADLRTLEVGAAVDAVAGLAANLVVCFCVGYLEGEAYYQSSILPHHPQLGQRDLLAEVLERAASHGLPVVAYVNTLWAGRWVSDPHPDWVQRRRNGEPTRQGEAVAICPNSPYAEVLVAATQEIARGYAVGGFFFDEPSFQSWCACGYCQRRFRGETGESLPLAAEWGEPRWHRFLEWRFASVASLVRRLHQAAREVDPGFTVFSQYHFPLSTPAMLWRSIRFTGPGRVPEEVDDWYRPTYYAERLTDYLADEDVIATETYWHAVEQPQWWVRAATSYCRSHAGEKPVLVLTEYPQLPWSLTALSPVELGVTIADVVASCGHPWFAWYGPGVGDPRGWETIGAHFRRLAAAEPEMAGLEPAAEIAVLHSRPTVDCYGRDRVRERCLDEVLGFYKAAMEAHLPCAVLGEGHLTEEGLAPFRVLCLPNTACLSAAERRAVAAFVAGGGGLVASFEVGRYDERGNPVDAAALDGVLGLRRSGELLDAGIGYLRLDPESPLPVDLTPRVPIPYRGLQMAVEPTGARVVARMIASVGTFGPPPKEDRHPAAVLAALAGRGRAVYFAGSVGRLYLRQRIPELADLLVAAMRWCLRGEPSVTAEGPSPLGVTVWRRADGGRVVFLTNSSTADSNLRPTLVPLTDVQVRFAGEPPTLRARSAFDGTEYPVRRERGAAVVRVPKLELLEALVVTS